MLGNGILETTTTTGTGDLTISQVTGRPRFSDVFTANASEASADLFYYGILTQDNPPQLLEVAKGWLSATGTLKRAEILATLVSGTYDNTSPSAVNLASGTKNVICTGEASTFAVSMPNIDATSSGVIRGIAAPHSRAGQAGVTFVNLRCWYLPFRMQMTQEITALKVWHWVNGSAGDRCRLGIYACNRNGYPGRRLVETGDLALDTGSGAAKSGSVGPIRLPAGWYFAAFAGEKSGSPQVSHCGISSDDIGDSASPLGHFNSAHFGRINARYEALSAGFTNLPANASSTTTGMNHTTDYIPIVIVGIA